MINVLTFSFTLDIKKTSLYDELPSLITVCPAKREIDIKMYATKQQQQQQQQLKPTNLNKNAAFIISKSNIVWTF